MRTVTIGLAALGVIVAFGAFVISAAPANATIPGRGLVEAARDFVNGYNNSKNNTVNRKNTNSAFRNGGNARESVESGERGYGGGTVGGKGGGGN